MVQSRTKAATSRTTAKTSALRGSMTPGDERPVLRALHEGVDVAVDVHVDGVGATGGEGAADHRRDDQPERGKTLGGDDLGRHRGDQQQLDDAELHQRHVGADLRAQRGGGGHEHDRPSLRPVQVGGPRRPGRARLARERAGAATLEGCVARRSRPRRTAGSRCWRSPCSGSSWSPARACGSPARASAAPRGRAASRAPSSPTTSPACTASSSPPTATSPDWSPWA